MATSKSNDTSVEIDDIKEQFVAMREEMKALTDLFTKGVSEQSGAAKGAALEKAELIRSEAIDKAKKVHSEAEKSIIANPLASVAICAGIGFLIGAVLRK